MSYSDVVMRHFHAPRNNRVDAGADAIGVAGNPASGPFMVLYLRLDGARITDACFQTHGCAPSIAAGSLLCTELVGTLLATAAAAWTEPAIDQALGGLPPHKAHCARLAAAALSSCASRLHARGGTSA